MPSIATKGKYNVLTAGLPGWGTQVRSGLSPFARAGTGKAPSAKGKGTALALTPNRTAEKLRTTGVGLPTTAGGNPLADRANWNTGGRQSSNAVDWFNDPKNMGLIAIGGLALVALVVLRRKRRKAA